MEGRAIEHKTACGQRNTHMLLLVIAVKVTLYNVIASLFTYLSLTNM